MISKPKILDLFCGAGGATKGLQRAGFYVVGVDNKPQPHYCGDEFHQADALEFPLEGYDAYWASPPCQAYSQAFSQLIGKRKEPPDLVAPIRERLVATGKPFIIENVPHSPLQNYIQLDGTMFGLKVKKTRNFELHGFEILLLPGKLPNTKGWIKDGKLVGIVQHSCYPNEKVKREHLAAAYEMDWYCTRHELRQAIPPAYSEYLGKYLMQEIESKAMAL